jgi:AraC-like DNA-binding protein
MEPGTVSVRMLWPFMRVLRDFAPEMSVLRSAGLDPSMLADPDARISRPILGSVIYESMKKTRDGALGVHAGERIESADFGVMDHAVCACPDIRRAFLCIARYVRLQDSNVEAHLIEEDDRAVWQLRNVLPSLLNATNDFQVTISIMNWSRRLGRSEPPLEIHLRHEEPTSASEYARVFRAPVRFGMPHNAVVFPRALLDAVVPSSNPDAFSAFDLRADRELRELDGAEGVGLRVRRFVLGRIGRDPIGLDDAGTALHMSAATLRRRLAEEGTTYRAIVDGVRSELGLRYVAEPRVAIGEIAFLLGFSTQSAFGTAFRRWTGTSPLDYRARFRRARTGT